MPTLVQEREVTNVEPPPVRRGSLIAGIALMLGLAVLVGVFARKWPFTQLSIMRCLQEQSGGTVEIGSFRQFYWPHPGCVAENVKLRRDANSPAFITIDKLSIVGTYPGLLAERLATVKAEHFHVLVSPESAPSGEGRIPSTVTIGKLIADGAEVEFPSDEKGGQSLVFRIPKIVVHEVSETNPLQFEATVVLPKPEAEVDVQGKFGPWQSGHAGDTALSGSFSLRDLDMEEFGDMSGRIASKGNFGGKLEAVKVNGTLDVPNFEVRQSKHPLHLVADYDATVDGRNGDVDLNAVRGRFRNTTIFGAGTVKGKLGQKGKTADVVLSSKDARIQDLLWMFVSENPPAMTGSIVFRASAQLPPDDRSFTEKVRVEGDFGISDAKYPNPDTQKNIDMLSARARGEAAKVEDTQEKDPSYDPGHVISDLKGHVLLKNAVAQLSDVSFNVPGASARVSGTYSLKNEKVDLRGHMHMEAELSKTTTGVKSVLLKAMRPFIHKSRHHESVVAIHIGGTYEHPTYGVVPKADK
jgi:hypothetical protein